MGVGDKFTKYGNAMPATRIGLMNELARVPERMGADIAMVSQGNGSDPRRQDREARRRRWRA